MHLKEATNKHDILINVINDNTWLVVDRHLPAQNNLLKNSDFVNFYNKYANLKINKKSLTKAYFMIMTGNKITSVSNFFNPKKIDCNTSIIQSSILKSISIKISKCKSKKCVKEVFIYFFELGSKKPTKLSKL